MARCWIPAGLLIGALASMPALGQSAAAPGPSRGSLLYATHCIACHSTQLHWRNARLARDWPGLKAEVRRWQAAARLAWSEDDIAEVARHLNALYYRYPEPHARWGASGDTAPRALQ